MLERESLSYVKICKDLYYRAYLYALVNLALEISVNETASSNL